MNNTNIMNFTGDAEVLNDIYTKIASINSAHTKIIYILLALFFYILILMHVYAYKKQITIPFKIGRYATEESEVIILEDDVRIYKIIKFSGEYKYVFEVKEKAKKERCEHRLQVVEVEETIEMVNMSGQGTQEDSTTTPSSHESASIAED